MYTNGDRAPADTGDIQVISYCVRGDATCGVGNPFAHPVSTLFYLAPGFYVHAFLNDDVNDYDQTAEWTVGNTTYVVLDGGNPWGMMLRDLGLPVPTEFDTALSTLVPVPMPGEQAAVAGQPVPTPRELQERFYQRHGWKVPVTDPDVVDKQDDQSTARSTAAVSNRVASPTATTKQKSADPAADEPQYSDEDEQGLQSTTTADKTAGTSEDTTQTAPTSDGESARDSGTTTSGTTTSSRPKRHEAPAVSRRVETRRRMSLGDRPQASMVRRDARVGDLD